MSDRRPALRRGLAAAILLTALPLQAGAQDQPLSASDWLSGSVRGPVRESSAWRPGDARPPVRKGPRPSPVAESGTVGAVSVTRLDHGNPDATGTQSPRRAGLPFDLWSGSDSATLARMVLETPARLQSMQGLLSRVLTAQLAAPDQPADDAQGQLFLARADRLLDMGALDDAQGLLLAAGPGEPEIFRRMFDIALLEGDESRACAIMNGTPGIAPSFAARIFCLAQTGDWSAAAVSLHGAEMLGLIEEREAVLLTHFLDDAYVDSPDTLAPPQNLSPLEFRIFEAIGQPLPTTPLPVAFAQSDLRLNSGFKARLEAAERLARAGALSPARLRHIYGEQPPAASGGVWDRAEALADLDAALAAGDHGAALIRCAEVFRAAGMADILAGMIAADLPEPPAHAMDEASETARLLRQWQGLSEAPLPAPPADLTAQIPPAPAARKGEELLTAMADIDAAIEGDMARAAKGIAMLIALGLPEDAARARRQIILLDSIGTERP
ncbi:hypothetical protein Q4511_06145 [Paracoccus sp. 1_MG-2023]|uniref:hypothetical protein n=1 Tax=unclassified Paracoccus (in: a-proteobacteria) TaxID=2688777 RepID=UPI001C09DCF3|nr:MULTISPECIES: hypothetical protein [unclassified Paracoccus (in: a-proteobacteria)]MBU2958516.1 hypothetical protein [Paracoccus sp. C2R09]MDO6668499.1 hypothetical protein [Paracoccus sp. 1_MG-2023]